MVLRNEDDNNNKTVQNENDNKEQKQQQKLSTKCCLVAEKLTRFRKIHYIELLILVFNLAQGLRASANFPSFYSKVCLEIYSSTPSICYDTSVNKTAENIVQKETARWLMYNEIIAFLPNLVMAMFFGSFGDKYGRKVPTLIAVTSMIVHNFLYMLFVSMPMFPVYILTLEAGLVAFGGTKTVFISAQYAEAAHQTEDKNALTQRFAILTACISCAIFVAGNISPVLLKYYSLTWIMFIGQIVMTVAFVLALFLHSPSEEVPKDVKQQQLAPPKQEHQKQSAKPTFKIPKMVRMTSVEMYGKTIAPRKTYSVKTSEKIYKSDHHEWFDRMLELYKSAWIALTKQRPNHGRLHLLLFCFVGLIYACADSGMDTVTTLYVYHAPISWTPAIFSRWMATMSIAQLVGGVVGTNLLKRFNFSDYTVVLVGLTSATLKMVCTSLANETWMMYLAMGLGCVSNVGISSLRSLITQLGDDSETGELTSMLSIVMGWAQLSGSLICNNIYTATVHYYTGFTFAVVAVLLTLCFFVILAIFYHHKRLLAKPTLPRHSSAVFYIDSIEV